MSQLILWHTDTDEFKPGQWKKGYVVQNVTLSPDGIYMVAGLMGNHQHTIICRPPYFSAIELWINGLCMTGVQFLPDGTLLSVNPHEVRSQTPCPLRRIKGSRTHYSTNHQHTLDASKGRALGQDQSGRTILFTKGKVFAVEEGTPKLLFDANPLTFEPIEPPDWATNW